MLICLRICSKMLLISQPKPSRSSTSRRTLPHSLRRSSTRNTTQPGIALSEEISAHTLPMKPSTLSTSTLVKWLSYSSNLVERTGHTQSYVHCIANFIPIPSTYKIRAKLILSSPIFELPLPNGSIASSNQFVDSLHSLNLCPHIQISTRYIFQFI